MHALRAVYRQTDRQTDRQPLFKSTVIIKAIPLMGSCINTKPKNKIYACFVEKTLFSFVQKEQFTEKREFDEFET